MKFFEDHFTRHNLTRNPHKWFAALVLSPIHHAEMRYKSHYHMKFSHAKKLFFFDMILLLSTIVLFVASLFWWRYDPTVTELVHLDVTASVETERLRSGDDIELTIEVHNQSDVVLTSPVLNMHLPTGFLIIEAPDGYSTKENQSITIPLDDFASDQARLYTVAGRYYGHVGEHESLQTMLIYTQEGKQTPESDVHRLFLTAREPSISIQANTPRHLIPGVDTAVSLTIANEQDHPLPPLTLSLQNEQVVWIAGSSDGGSFSSSSGMWHIESLKTGETVRLDGNIRVSPTPTQQELLWTLTSSLTTNGQTFDEFQQSIPITVARPGVRIDSSWSDPFVYLGEQSLVAFNITNTGNVSLKNPAIVYNERTFQASVSSLAVGQSIPLSIPISAKASAITQHEDGPIVLPSVSFVATIDGVSAYTYTTDISIDPIPVVSTLSLHQYSTYYTVEGDQLGRGPLPPKVGKETKYWIFTQIKNTVGEVQDVLFETTLHPSARWTGKSSVSKGGDITFDPSSRTATWQSRSMYPYETVGIYFEVATIPGINDIGTVPGLISKSSIRAFDPHVEAPLEANFGSLNASLIEDPIGQAKGTVVQ